ncbi:hypothetical protein H0H92_015630 [Tricholoma furcatifolium]|nr:hypothetical protein H0H92_015630 [Tricholoma furcatifolium]
MSLYKFDWSNLWKDERYFGLPPSTHLMTLGTDDQASSDGSLVEEVYAVAKDLIGGTYQLGQVDLPFEPAKDLEVYEALTQSAFFWERAARPLASQLATAKYPIRAQASHLIFWWARLGGLMGVTSIKERTGEHMDSCTSDGSNMEFSWAIPNDTDPSEDSNRRIRFTIDPVHPERGHRIAGGAVLDYLWSPEGSMGLVKNDPGSKDWKDTMEKWLFPDLESSEQFVEGTTYMVAFDMEPSGEITLKQYYVPPHPAPPGVEPKNRVASYRVTDDLEPFKRLVKDLHPSLEAPFNMFVDFVHGDGKESKMKWFMIACDVTKSEKNRLKVYLLSERSTLKDMIYDMTLGGRITGPKVDVAMANFSKFFTHLFPYAQTEKTDIHLENDINGLDEDGRVSRDGVHMMYYYEFFVGEPFPYSKIYFFMDHFSKNDYETAKATELFFEDVGKPGAKGWMVDALSHANSHRLLEKRNGIHTMASFGTKPAGWDVTNYYSAEIFAPERDI